MVWLILFGALASWGLLCALWALFGWLLPSSSEITVLLCPATGQDGAVARFRWLQSLGLIQGRLILVCSEARGKLFTKMDNDMEYCSPEEIPGLLEAERVT